MKSIKYNKLNDINSSITHTEKINSYTFVLLKNSFYLLRDYLNVIVWKNQSSIYIQVVISKDWLFDIFYLYWIMIWETFYCKV